MKWIVDDIYRAVVALKRWQTWLGIGLISTFAGLAYLVTRYSFQTDAVLIFLHRTAASCQTLSNGTIIAMFFSMIFFTFTAVLTLGEFQRYVDYKRRAAHHQARQSLIWGIVWITAAVSIAVSALVFFTRYCR
ncbi:hypothetical protein LZ012_09955 [Dechloromonas sp. XY25]|uniref:DUF202 domain-containing protein n=1 Tax=Dechloromonas hankyongensis TaxID=2908002 RepID=A0ABS9K2A9_9RHOO|nr:hypothetical protein [Dechloromonas hankyongensis]MCG2577317.1 hypothetical protein [Dechloromonas hankyongensis]